MAREFSRSDRLAAQIQRELSILLQREINDPRLAHVTINAVILTHDLSIATAYFSAFTGNEESKKNCLLALGKAAAFLRYKLGARLKVRNVPEIKFVYDESIDRSARIETILEGIEQQKSEPKP